MMNERNSVKKDIIQAFAQNDFDNAFTKLLSLPDYEINQLLNKHGWLAKNIVYRFFFSDYIVSSHSVALSGVKSEIFLSWYLKKPQCFIDSFNSLLLEQYAPELITAIKRNRAFLNANVFNIISSWKWNLSNKVDVLVWEVLRDKHYVLQTQIEEIWLSIQSYPKHLFLAGLSKVIDESVFNDSSPYNIEHLRLSFDYAISLILTQSKDDKRECLPELEFDKFFFNSLESEEFKTLKKFIEAINRWIQFKSSDLDSYCFDDNVAVDLIEDKLKLHYKSTTEYSKWVKDGERYIYNALRYEADAKYEAKTNIESCKFTIPEGSSSEDKAFNLGVYVKSLQSNLFFKDMCIKDLRFRNNNVPVSKYLVALNTYSVNRKYRYSEQMYEFKKQGLNWVEALMKQVMTSQRNGVSNVPLPYMYLTEIELSKLYCDAMPELASEEFTDMIKHFAYLFPPGKTFNPFDIRYSVAEVPFVKLGDFIYCPTVFFATNDWFYSLGQRILTLYANKFHVKERNETATEMEHYLAKLFESYKWNAKVLNSTEANKINGDIDLIVSDEKSQLLIQLKRTKFKLRLEDTYKDTMETDLKAVGQLVEAEKYIKENKLAGVELRDDLTKWVVTTSFEGVLNENDGCIKVNYFDLVWTIKKKDFGSLLELIQYIESDGPFNDNKKLMEPYI